MYSVPQNQQLIIFLASIGLGFILGILYDVLRAVRLTVSKSNILIVIFDIIYFLLFGFFTFLFILAMNKGEVRFYIPVGETLGWLFYYFSFGLAAIKITDILVKLIRGFFSLIIKLVTAPFRLIIKVFSIISAHLLLLFKKIGKISKKIAKKLLQKARVCVYNLFGVLLIRKKDTKKGGGNFGKSD